MEKSDSKRLWGECFLLCKVYQALHFWMRKIEGMRISFHKHLIFHIKFSRSISGLKSQQELFSWQQASVLNSVRDAHKQHLVTYWNGKNNCFYRMLWGPWSYLSVINSGSAKGLYEYMICIQAHVSSLSYELHWVLVQPQHHPDMPVSHPASHTDLSTHNCMDKL